MKLSTMAAGLIAVGAVAALAAPAPASAKTLTQPGHQRTWTTDDGWKATVSSTKEKITVVPGLPGATTREAFVTLKASARLTPPRSGKATPVAGKLTNGFQVTCQLSLQGISPNFGGNAGFGGGGGTSGPIPQWNIGPSAGVQAGVSLNLAPGEIKTVSFDEKTFESGAASTITREGHINVDGCAGPVLARSVTVLQVATSQTNDSNAVYGKVVQL